MDDRKLLSGDEAVALAAKDAGIALGTGYPGTPSTEILEAFGALGGNARWAPNERSPSRWASAPPSATPAPS